MAEPQPQEPESRARSRRWISVRSLITVAVLLLLVGSSLLGWSWLRDSADIDDTDPALSADKQSTDLKSDLRLMWETEKGRSTTEAMRAACRVFGTVELVGLKRDEVIALLGDPRTTGTPQHSIPWYPAGGRELVYRFDNGAHGYQFNIKFDWTGTVRRVERLGIE